MTPTIRDVALKAGVSFQVAAAVLGRKKYARASESTRKKIFDAARELNYVPNVSARILRGDASRIIGVLIDSRAPESMYGVLAEIERSADELGYRILSAQAHDNPEKLLQAYHSLKQNGVDGIISFSHDYAQLGCHLDRQLKDDPRIVFVLNAPEPVGAAADVDYFSGMKTALNYLRRRGYAQTALILRGGGPEILTLGCQRRLEGFRQCSPDGKVFYLTPAREDLPGLERACSAFVREQVRTGHIDSVIAQDDKLALVLMRVLLSEGIRIPHDFGVIGFDNLSIDECLPITLSSLYYDKKELADSVLKILLDRIAGETAPARVVCKMKFAPRESTDRKPANIKHTGRNEK